MKMEILYEDGEVVLAVKPAGTPTQADKTGDIDMLAMLRERSGEAYAVHRLDRPVGGLLLLAKNERACARLSADFAAGRVMKTYMAVACGRAEESDSLRHFLLKNQRMNVSRVVREGTKSAKEAVLSYKRLGLREDADEGSDKGPLCLLEITPRTGRHHQIRVQMAASGLPLWGDTKYNPAFLKPKQFVHVALWARELSFTHPAGGETLQFSVNPPEDQYPFSLF